MSRIARLFLSQRLKGSMSRDANDFNNIETRDIIKNFYTKQGVEKINAILTETIVGHSQKLGGPV